MPDWTADYANDPNDDYNLIIEILCDDKDVAVIKQSESGPLLTWYASTNNLVVPVDWMAGLLEAAKERLVWNPGDISR